MAMTGEHRGVTSRHLRTVFAAGAVGSLSDGRLLERFLAGRGDDDSASAFAALVERHGPMILGVCRDALGNLHDAEDAAQATFLVLAKRAGSIRRADSVASWLFGVALKVAAKARVRASRRRAIEQRGAEMKAHAIAPDMTPETRSEVHAELDRLPERFRAPIVLCHLEGLSNEQAAGQLGLPVRTLQRRLEQGRERLKERLVRRGVAPAVGAGLLSMGPAVEAASEAWIEATVRAAAALAAGRAVGAVASAPVAALAQAVLTGSLLARLVTLAACVLVAASAGVLAYLGARQQARPTAVASRGEQDTPPPMTRLGPWIQGIVVDERGRPVADARVASLWAVQARPVTSKADGTFSLPTDEPRRLNQSIIATADGGARQGIFRFDGPSGFKSPRSVVRVVIRPAQNVTVTVVDGQGAPVPDAAVFVLDLYFPVAEARTDARGIAVLRVPADTSTLWILGCKPGVGCDYFENYKSTWMIPFSPPPATARLVLDGVRTVRIRAIDSAGRPVQGLEMYPITIHKKGKLRAMNIAPLSIDPRTDAEGVATFDWLPAQLGGWTHFSPVTVWAGQRLASLSYAPSELPALDPDKPAAELTARLVRCTRVSGKVSMPDGSPAAGILVEAHGVGGNPSLAGFGSGRARTADDGSYAMELAPELSYMIGVSDDEWAATSRSAVVVREGVPQVDLDLTLERGKRAAVVWGRVTAGRDAKPAPGQPVVLVEGGLAIPPGTFKNQPAGLNDAFQRIADTDDDGRFAFRVGPGSYRLTGPRIRGGQNGAVELKVVAGQQYERNFSLPREDKPWKTLRGVVRAKGAGGAPIPGAIMVFQPVRVPSVPGHGSADDQGRFEVFRQADKIIIYARSPEGDLAGYVVFDGKDDELITIEARPAATARGRVVDEKGQPWGSVEVGYLVEAGLPAVGRDGPPGAGQSVLTDADGRFTAPGLPPGSTCRFRAYVPGTEFNPPRRVEVKDAQPFEVPPLVITRPATTRSNDQ